nr:threonine/serine exporter family protein [Blautia argi]
MKSYDKKVLDLSMEAGRILLDAGAEIFRVEETIERISRAFGIEKCSPFVMSTGIFLTAENEEGEIYASVKHIPIQGAKLYRVAAVNQLSREIVEGKYTLEEAEERLETIKKMPGKRSFMRILAAGVGLWEVLLSLGENLRICLPPFYQAYSCTPFWC